MHPESKTGGEFFVHRERPDGTRELIFGPIGSQDHAHTVLKPNGNPVFIREIGGRLICDDQKS